MKCSALSRRLGMTGEYGVVQALEDGAAQARQLMIEAVETAGQVIAQSALLTDPGAIIVAWTLVQQIPSCCRYLKTRLIAIAPGIAWRGALGGGAVGSTKSLVR